MLILCPVITIFLPTAPLIVRLLLTKSFLPVIPFLSWAILGMIFKVVSTSMGYILIVKGAHRLFLGTELFSWSTILITNIIGYTLWGIEGIGIAFLFSYVCYFILIGTVCYHNFKIGFNKEIIQILLFTITIAVGSFITTYYWIPTNQWTGYAFDIFLILIACTFSFRKLWSHIK